MAEPEYPAVTNLLVVSTSWPSTFWTSVTASSLEAPPPETEVTTWAPLENIAPSTVRALVTGLNFRPVSVLMVELEDEPL